MNKEKIWLYGSVFFCSLCFHIFYLFATHTLNNGPETDTVDFLQASDSILKGKGFSKENLELTLYPAFPIFLALCRLLVGDDWMLGHNLLGFKILSLILYSLSSVVGVWFAGRLFGKKTAWIAALFLVFSPTTAFWSHAVMTECLFTFCLILSLALFFVWLQDSVKSFGILGVSGLCFAIASLTRPILFPLLIPLICFLGLRLFFHKKERIAIDWPLLRKSAALFLGLVFLVFGFWQWKNQEVGAGTSFLPLDKVQSSFKKNLWRFYLEREFPNTHEKDYWAKARMKFQSAISTPSSYLHWSFTALGAKFSEYWTLSITGNSQSWRHSLVLQGYLIYYGVTFLFLLLSLFFIRKNIWALSFLWMIVVYFTLVHTVTLRGGGAANRYRVPLEPYIGILAAYGVANTLSMLRRQRSASGMETGPDKLRDSDCH